jgi:hypothetical protein
MKRKENGNERMGRIKNNPQKLKKVKYERIVSL